MTVWAPRRIAGFAVDAGFAGSDVVTAVAVALAGSDGADHVHYSTATPPVRTQRGLWLIPVGMVVADPDGRLFDPQHNADAAFALTVTAGAGWEWSTVFKAGTWRTLIAEAVDAAEHPERTQPASLTLTRPGAGQWAKVVRSSMQQFTGKAG